jgi:hypothetical protein
VAEADRFPASADSTLNHGTSRALREEMHATFIQKVIICAVAGFAAACLIQWAKVFVEGADKALNGGYEHRTVMGSEKK